MRSNTPITGVGINTINRLLVDAGTGRQEYHEETVRDVDVEDLQADELWSFVYARQKNAHKATGVIDAVGDSWTWTAIDPDTKLMVSWLVGDRTLDSATEFMEDIHSRVKGGIRLSMDGHQPYVRAVDSTFGSLIDYGQVVKNHRLKGAKNETLEAVKEDFIGKVTVSGAPEIETVPTIHYQLSTMHHPVPCQIQTVEHMVVHFSAKCSIAQIGMEHFGTQWNTSHGIDDSTRLGVMRRRGPRRSSRRAGLAEEVVNPGCGPVSTFRG